MTCQSASPFLGPYLDGELDAAQTADVVRHLAECPACEAAHQRLAGLSADLRTLAPRYDASEQLRARIATSLRKPAAPAPTPISTRWRGWAIAATALLAVSIGWNAMQLRSRANADLEQQLLSSHVRSLIGDHLLDVPSTDRHNVKPWFNGKLDYSPDVKDLADSGFPLVGGRIDYIDGRRTAVLVYKRAQHVINLFVWPGASPAASQAENGFHMLCWNRTGMAYCAVSDLNKEELGQFAGLYNR